MGLSKSGIFNRTYSWPPFFHCHIGILERTSSAPCFALKWWFVWPQSLLKHLTLPVGETLDHLNGSKGQNLRVLRNIEMPWDAIAYSYCNLTKVCKKWISISHQCIFKVAILVCGRVLDSGCVFSRLDSGFWWFSCKKKMLENDSIPEFFGGHVDAKSLIYVYNYIYI